MTGCGLIGWRVADYMVNTLTYQPINSLTHKTQKIFGNQFG